MRIRTLYLIIILFLSSCKEEDNFQWNLERTSHNDGRLKVSELSYTINCADLNQFIDTPSFWWDWGINSNGYKGSCIATRGRWLDKENSVNFLVNNIEDCIIRFHYRMQAASTSTPPLINIKLNSKTLNSAIINGDVYSNEWCQIQTGVIKKGNNQITLTFKKYEAIFFIDEIELWKPKNLLTK